MADVEFPPWCADAAAFVKYHRACLESERVSRLLHKWIDLFFGYKLRGRAAVDAKNVTLPPPRSHTTLGKPAEFVRLFNRPHPKRRPPPAGSLGAGDAHARGGADARRHAAAHTRRQSSMAFGAAPGRGEDVASSTKAVVDLEKVHAFALEHHHIVMPRYAALRRGEGAGGSDLPASSSSSSLSALSSSHTQLGREGSGGGALSGERAGEAAATAGEDDLFAAGCIIAELFLCRPLFGQCIAAGDDAGGEGASAHVQSSLSRLPPVVAAAIAALTSEDPPSAALLLRQTTTASQTAGAGPGSEAEPPNAATQADRRFRGLFPKVRLCVLVFVSLFIVRARARARALSLSSLSLSLAHAHARTRSFIFCSPHSGSRRLTPSRRE